MNQRSDEIIVEEVKRGASEAYGELIERYEHRLKRYGKKFLSRKEDIEDLVQDIFVKAYEHLNAFDSKLRFSPWIYRIAHNTFINELKRQSRYGNVFDAEVILPLVPAQEKTDTPILEQEITEELEHLLTFLEPKYREVIVLYYYENLQYQEISDVLKISVSAVGVRMTRAREKLRSLYNQNNYE